MIEPCILSINYKSCVDGRCNIQNYYDKKCSGYQTHRHLTRFPLHSHRRYTKIQGWNGNVQSGLTFHKQFTRLPMNCLFQFGIERIFAIEICHL